MTTQNIAPAITDLTPEELAELREHGILQRDDYAKLNLIMRWCIYAGDTKLLDLRANAPDGEYTVTTAYLGAPVTVPGLTVKNGQFTPENVSEVCHQAVIAAYGDKAWTHPDRLGRRRPHHSFIESLVFDADAATFHLAAGS